MLTQYILRAILFYINLDASISITWKYTKPNLICIVLSRDHLFSWGVIQQSANTGGLFSNQQTQGDYSAISKHSHLVLPLYCCIFGDNSIDAKSPAFGWRLQLSDSISSSPAEQAKSPAELGLTNFVIHMSCKLLFHKRKTVHDLRNCEIYEKSAAN